MPEDKCNMVFKLFILELKFSFPVFKITVLIVSLYENYFYQVQKHVILIFRSYPQFRVWRSNWLHMVTPWYHESKFTIRYSWYGRIEAFRSKDHSVQESLVGRILTA